MIRSPVLENFSELARRGVAFDMVVRPQHFRNVV
jgi:hypothetical protein